MLMLLYRTVLTKGWNHREEHLASPLGQENGTDNVTVKRLQSSLADIVSWKYTVAIILVPAVCLLSG